MSVSAGAGADLLAAARRVLHLEAEALLAMERRLDESFLEAVRLIDSARGRVIVSGLGKSGIVRARSPPP
jgi:arabinose-5-phosphate isomerase